ncbi:MAG TPA: thiamine pyrophosphate-binding protein [Acidimicrobiales bacterium]|nr:thiamine pyrophosphate-binding protein [Acidimicrobiales bacterium]
MKRVADLVADLLVEHGISDMFVITGGGAMHLNDAFGRNPELSLMFCHHEQACAIAAEAYGRLTHRLAAVNVTTGPGGINALNGVYGAFVDSIGMVVVSGQVKTETMVSSYDLPLRQLGDQEVDIIELADSITKYAVVLTDPSDTTYVVERAIWTAKHGRPGPVWIDIPSDIQAAVADPLTQRRFDPEEPLLTDATGDTPLSGPALRAELAVVLERLSLSERPVVLAGTGVRISGAYEQFLKVIDKLGVPVATAFNAHDLVGEDHPLYVGRPGTVGDRAGNFAVQNADFVLILGCRMNLRQISYEWSAFAREAYKVMIDIDRAELSKPTLKIDQPILADLSDVLETISRDLGYQHKASHQGYLSWCQDRRRRYPVLAEPRTSESKLVDPYDFLSLLFDELDGDDVVVTGDGTACVVTFQVAKIQQGQRMFSNSGCASMGYDVPAAIGAAVARNGKRVVCVAGDGSIMMNLQELQTIVGNRLPVKIFLMNNGGYSSIRQTQTNYFPDNPVGCDPTSGVTFPDFVAVGQAFGIDSRRCDSLESASAEIRAALEGPGPRLLEVMLDPDRAFTPKLSSRALPDGRMVSSPLEDMAPFLAREELAASLLVPPYLGAG